MSKNYIQLKLKIKRENGGNLRGFNNDAVGPINLIGKTIFKQCKLYLSSKLIYDSGDVYGYRAFLETVLNYEQAQKSSLLVAAGYELDAPADHIDDNQNTGWASRAEDYDLSNTVELMAPLHMDLFFQEKFLLNQMDLRLELHRQDENFALMCFAAGHEQYKLTVEDIRWWVRKVDLSKPISLAIESTLLRNTAKYPVRRVQIKVIQIAGGRRDTPINSVFNGQIPRRLIIGVVDNDSFHGSFAKSPFNFKHFDASSIYVTAGGINYPSIPIQMNFQTNMFAEPYVLLYETLGYGDKDRSCWISPKEYKMGHCLYCFDLTQDSADGSHWQLLKEGCTSIHLTFRANIPAAGAKLICFSESDSIITIDRYRNVYCDFTA